MELFFITGNKGKLREARDIFPEIQSLDIDLTEIQSLDAQEIIEYKLKQAFLHHTGEFIVEDTSVYVDEMKGLPGPLIKWFLETIGVAGLAGIVSNLPSSAASAKVIVGYAKNQDDIHFFEAEMKGNIVAPRGDGGFGWDVIFVPEGHDRTLAEMTPEEKSQIGVRHSALRKLKDFLG